MTMVVLVMKQQLSLTNSVYFAQQLAPRVQSAYDIDHLATSVVADVLFGAALSHATSSTSLGVVNFVNP